MLTVRGLDAPVVAELAEGGALLLGRAPRPEKLEGAFGPAEKVRCVALASPHVSANHCVLWSTPGGVFVRDLESKNGTWSRLAPGQSTPAPAGALSLALATPGAEAPAEALPSEPLAWGDGDFGDTVAEAATQWLARQGVSSEARVVSSSLEGAENTLPLADGGALALVAGASATVDARWPALREALAAFVDAQNAHYEQELGHEEGFALRSPAFREAHGRVFEAAQRGRRALLLGPSGAGKERLAECYHRHSRRAEGPFKPVHCGLLEKDMLWVQLFGATRGSFTGAVRDVAGAVESAHGGTLFLDEVAELSPRMQSALLRFLDRKGEYERLGDPRARYADVQVVCATNVDLRGAVAQGHFREDLWYRFAATVVRVPPLRERPEDLEYFLRRRELAPGLSAWSALSGEAQALLRAHEWPGNLRELDNLVQRLPSVTRAGALGVRAVRDALEEGTTAVTPKTRREMTREEGAGFGALLAEASAAYLEDHGGEDPAKLGDARRFFEEYLRPLFVARGCAVHGLAALPEGLNYSALGRALDIADGTTVKKNLARYFERFGKGRTRDGTG